MKILKITALMISLIGIFYIAYGMFAVYIASWNVAELTDKMSHDIAATGAPWGEWQQSFSRAGIKAIGLGFVTVLAGVGIFKAKPWGKAIWIIMSPILLLSQFAQGQKSLTHFNSQVHFQIAWVLLVIVVLTWLMLLLPSSRKTLESEHRTSA